MGKSFRQEKVNKKEDAELQDLRVTLVHSYGKSPAEVEGKNKAELLDMMPAPSAEAVSNLRQSVAETKPISATEKSQRGVAVQRVR